MATKSRRSLTLDYTDNPELQEVFARKNPGDKCKLTVTLQVDRVDKEGMEGTIEEITPDESYATSENGPIKNPGNGATKQEVVHMNMMAAGDADNGPDNAYLT